MNINDGLYLATAVLSVAGLVFRPFKKYRRNAQYHIITFLLWNLFATAAACVFRSYAIQNSWASIKFLNELESLTYFILHTLLTPMFTLYIMLMNGAAKNRGRKFFVLFWIPAIVAEILVLLSPFFNLVFFYDEGGNYYRRHGIIVLYFIAAMYYTYAVVFLVKTWRFLKNEYMDGYHVFLILVVIGIAVQAVFPDLQIETLIVTIAVIGLLLIFDCNDGLIDGQTKLPNQFSYKLNMNLYRSYRYEYAVINIRFLNLAYYEHLLSKKTFQKLILLIVNTIENSAPKSEIYRYDFETFILVLKKNVPLEQTVRRVTEFFEQMILIDDFSIDFRTLVSIARIPEDLDRPDSHFLLAEYRPKKVNTQMTVLEGKKLNFIKRTVQVEAAIHQAVKSRSFEVYYQPIWDKDRQKIISCEALCRLKDRNLGTIGSEEFIPIAEQNGTIVYIANIVFEKVCRDISSLKFKTIGIESVEVNLSLYQLMTKGLSDRYRTILEKYGVPASMINLEITESASPVDAPEFSKVLKQLTDIGFTFSLDDYGTGYSNITNIMSVKYLNVKIDAAILWKASLDEHTKILLESTIKTFRKLGYNIIQEGVETKLQLDLVTRAGANLIQGYYFSRPVPAADFVQYVKSFNKKSI